MRLAHKSASDIRAADGRAATLFAAWPGKAAPSSWLLARAARGRDLVFLQPRWPAPRDRKQNPPAADAGGKPPRRPPVRRPDTDASPDPDSLPTLAQLEAEARRRPIGYSMGDICRDVAVAPGLCAGWMWNLVFFSLRCYRGNLASLVGEFLTRPRIRAGHNGVRPRRPPPAALRPETLVGTA